MSRKTYSLDEEVLGYLRVRRPQQARPARASDDIDWPELLSSFIVALLLTVAGIVTYFWAYAAGLGQ